MCDKNMVMNITIESFMASNAFLYNFMKFRVSYNLIPTSNRLNISIWISQTSANPIRVRVVRIEFTQLKSTINN